VQVMIKSTPQRHVLPIQEEKIVAGALRCAGDGFCRNSSGTVVHAVVYREHCCTSERSLGKHSVRARGYIISPLAEDL